VAPLLHPDIGQPWAWTDLLAGFRWLADQSPTAAARWHAGLEKAIAKLSQDPERHPLAEEETERLENTIRQVLYGRNRGDYRTLSTIHDQTVSILHIRHSAQGPLEP
jgi:plasmid stabilization system protein ParE